jgi:hypothetical protein
LSDLFSRFLHLLVACDPPTEEDRRARDFDNDGNDIGPLLKKRQVIMEMTMEIWQVSPPLHRSLPLAVLTVTEQEAIELFDIKKGIIPHRIEEAPAKPEGWYA